MIPKPQLFIFLFATTLCCSQCSKEPEPSIDDGKAKKQKVTTTKKLTPDSSPSEAEMAEFESAFASESKKNNDGFLSTDFKPLADWFDNRYKMEYRALTIDLIFDQVPLNEIHYELDESTKGIEGAFNFSSPNISRRELLEKIKEHWGLEMVLVYNDEENPVAVRVMAAK